MAAAMGGGGAGGGGVGGGMGVMGGMGGGSIRSNNASQLMGTFTASSLPPSLPPFLVRCRNV